MRLFSRYLKRCRILVSVHKKTGAFDDESMDVNYNIMEGMTDNEVNKDMAQVYALMDDRCQRNNITTLQQKKEKEAHEASIADLKKQERTLKNEVDTLQRAVNKLRGQETHLLKHQKVVPLSGAG